VALSVLPFAAVACGDDGGAHGGPESAGALSAGDAGRHLVITTDNGLRLRSTDGQVAVDDGVRRHWSHHDDTWTLDLSCDDRTGKHGSCPRMPRVDVPDGMSVTVTARNAGIDVAGVADTLDLTTVNGDVTVTRSGRSDGSVRLMTRNGSVRTVALEAGRLHAATVNGDVLLDCVTSPSGVTATTTNGSVDVTVPSDAPAYRVDATTDNGAATVTVPTAKDDAGHHRTMTLTTVNGNVDAHRHRL
jgi:hypothetical protein